MNIALRSACGRGVSAALICIAFSCSLLALPAGASAHDSLSPKNANHNWLPKEDWIGFHWSPFDELRLVQLLGISHLDLYLYQADDHKPIADLARSRGIDPKKLREDLIAPFKAPGVSKHRLKILRQRTSRMLTQPHLAQHEFWHPFHEPAFKRDAEHSAKEMFGVTVKKYRAMRRAGKTELEIATVGGKSAHHLRMTILHHMKMELNMGVGMQETPRSQAVRLYKRQLSLVDCWMNTPLPQFDPNIPFGGDINGGHGTHDRNSGVGIVTPKPAAGCWLPIVPTD